nr:MAG TPA: hypothetical protein [Caudoviricetes sp.]
MTPTASLSIFLYSNPSKRRETFIFNSFLTQSIHSLHSFLSFLVN